MNLSAIDAHQRLLMLRPREAPLPARTIGRCGSLFIAAAIATITSACAPAPSASAAVSVDRIHAQVSDARGSAGAAIIGEMTQLKITESAEPVFGRSTAHGTLSGRLVLRNVSAGQIVRVIGVNVRYITFSDQPIGRGAGRSTVAMRAASTQLSFEPLGPGKAVAQIVHVEIPNTKNLKEVRFEFSFAASPATEGNYPHRDDREQTLQLVVPIARG